MSLEENKDVVRRFVYEGVIGGNLAKIPTTVGEFVRWCIEPSLVDG